MAVTMTQAQILAVIATGQSVLYRGRHYIKAVDVPDDVTLAGLADKGIAGKFDAFQKATQDQTSITGNYSLLLTDATKRLIHPSADTTARTVTIPANTSVAFPVGTKITILNQNGAGALTIAITSDTMRLSPGGTTGSRTLAANGKAEIEKITATEWMICGFGLT